MVSCNSPPLWPHVPSSRRQALQVLFLYLSIWPGLCMPAGSGGRRDCTTLGLLVMFLNAPSFLRLPGPLCLILWGSGSCSGSVCCNYVIHSDVIILCHHARRSSHYAQTLWLFTIEISLMARASHITLFWIISCWRHHMQHSSHLDELCG